MSITPRVRLMELREYVSERTGKTYFSGYLGKSKVMVFRDERAECTGREKARWTVMLEDQEPRETRDGSSSPPPDRGRDGSAARHAGSRPSAGSQRYASRPASRSSNRAAQDRQAASVMRDLGLDPSGLSPDDALPF